MGRGPGQIRDGGRGGRAERHDASEPRKPGPDVVVAHFSAGSARSQLAAALGFAVVAQASWQVAGPWYVLTLRTPGQARRVVGAVLE